MLPLRLTPFEEYMLVDDQPVYPMSCFFMIKLRGRFDVSVFDFAVKLVLPCHPFLSFSVKEKKGQYFWHDAGKMPPIVRKPLNEKCRFPASQGIDLFDEPALKITICHADTEAAGDILEGETDIVFEVHHSASDAAGTARFIEDVLCAYAQQTGLAISSREPVNPDLLFRRGTFGSPRNNILRTLPKQCWGLHRAWTFLLNRVVPLTYEKPLDLTKPPADYPAILCKEFTAEETQLVLHRTKEQGITVNDSFLCAAFFAMKNWREKHVTDKQKGNLRIAVPTNLRISVDELMPAANIVSMVFLDRKPEQIQKTESFYRAVHREMQHIKRCNLGWAFIHGLTLYKRVFGNFRKMTRQNRCWSTATVTNLGKVFNEVPLSIRGGSIQIGESLELFGIETAPPVRSGTALGISTMTYSDRMTINLHYDSNVLTRVDSQAILDDVVDEVCKK